MRLPETQTKSSRLRKEPGFTIIELLVVISIIAFIAAVIMVAVNTARQRARDVKRLGDMSQIVKGFELYFDNNKGYPGAITFNGTNAPASMTPTYVSSLPFAPTPADGSCGGTVAPSPATSANTYYYEPTGTSYIYNGVTVYPNYNYYFCLGGQAGNIPAGLHTLTPGGIN